VNFAKLEQMGLDANCKRDSLLVRMGPCDATQASIRFAGNWL